jgi:hypothetical protein
LGRGPLTANKERAGNLENKNFGFFGLRFFSFLFILKIKREKKKNLVGFGVGASAA